MINGVSALILNYLAITVFSISFTGLVLALVQSKLMAKLLNYPAQLRRRLLVLVVASPWLISLCLLLLAFAPQATQQMIPPSLDFLFWHHSSDYPLVSWHSVTIIVLFVFLTSELFRAVKRLLIQRGDVSALTKFSHPYKVSSKSIDSDEINAFTAGFLRPRYYVTSKLLNSLSESELAIIEKH